VTVTTIFETAWALRGLEQMMIDFTEDPDLAETILDFPFRYHLAAAERLVEMGVDMIWTGDDVGMQHGMMISPNTWRRFLKPRMAEFISTLKAMALVALRWGCDILAEMLELWPWIGRRFWDGSARWMILRRRSVLTPWRLWRVTRTRGRLRRSN